MINQVGNSSVNVFSEFRQPQNGNYFIMPQNNEEKKKLSGKKIALYAVGTGFGILALTKGAMSKSFSKVLNKWKLGLEKKLSEDSSLKNFYRFAHNRINSFLNKLESINNFTTMKDVIVQKAMYGKNGERTFTRKIHEGITKFFDRISRKTVNSSYATTSKKFAGLNERILSINEQLLRENPDNINVQKAVETVNRRMSRVNSQLQKGFGIEARGQRLQQMNSASEGLFDYFWNASLSDIKNFRSKNMWQSYIADDYLMPYKMKMSSETSKLRRSITHDISDTYKATMKAVENIQQFVKPTDRRTNKVLNDLRINLDKYQKLSGKDEVSARLKLNEEIVENLKRLSSEFGAESYKPEVKTSISNYIKDIESIISNSSKGELQEILTLYKGVLPEKEYNKLKKMVKGAVKSLDNSIEVETVKYFDKARDLKLGSAPTDVISILAGAGTVGWFLGKSKDRDERISASLKYGIPAVVTIATSLYCTARLISGGKGLLFGLLTGAVANKLGEYVDATRKKYAVDISIENKLKAKPQPDNV